MINPPGESVRLHRPAGQAVCGQHRTRRCGHRQLYRKLYARLANLYRASDSVQLDDTDFLSAAGAVLKTDADFSAAIALTFRLDLVNVFFAGDLYAGTGVVTDPKHPPKVGDSLEEIARRLREKPFAEYFSKVFVPYYSAAAQGRHAGVAAGRTVT